MYIQTFEQLGKFVVKACLISIMGFGLASYALADDPLMQPVQDIYFHELPPPWASEPVPKIGAALQVAKITTQSTPKPAQKPVVKHVTRPTPKPAVQIPAAKPTTIQSLLSAANQNNSQAQYDLGMRYQYGNGVQKSRSTAHRWLNKSAEAGNARAQYALSLFYQQYARNQQGVKKALLWLKSAADQGLADAQYSLGMMFKNGSLVHNNPVESRRWLQMAASQGHIAAQLALQ
ncbi:MAG: tetratricopeptide repeat protein [Thiotrichaceae bacterium]